MIIRELFLKNFGRFSEKAIELHPGIHLITGKNESGKTTAAVFIKAMLFGMKRGRGKAAAGDAFGHFLPWNGGLMEGSLTFESKGRSFRLNRIFPDQTELFCLDDGEVLDVDKGDLQMLLGGIKEGLFLNTFYTGYGEAALARELGGQLETYFLNMENEPEERADIQAALQYLKDRKKSAEKECRVHKELRMERCRSLEKRLEEYRKEEERLHRKMKELDAWERPEALPQEKDRRGKNGWKIVLLAAGLAWAGAVFFIVGAQWSAAAALGGTAAVLTGAGCFLGRKEKKRCKERQRREEAKWQEYKTAELTWQLEKKHLEEACLEVSRERMNCEEERAELDVPGTQEKRWHLEAQASADAMGRIRKAAEELAADWARHLEAQASDILRSITEGKYFGLKIAERMECTVTDGRRIYRPDQLSSGTREQIWMSVRLAAAMSLEEELPFLFDDAFLSWDEDRLEGLFDWLSSCGRQVLLFTGQNREEEILKRRHIPYLKIVLDE